MYNHNISSYSININKVNTVTDFNNIINDIFGNIDYIFSYYIDITNAGYKLLFKVSDNPEFNTVNIKDFANKLWTAICNEKTPLFEQPDLDIYVKSYDNFFNKLASRFHRDWPFIDFDEFKQLCYLALVKLYKGNYMINKNLLQKSCTNEILLFLRKYKHESETVSIYGKVKNEKNADLSLASILIDEREMRRLEEEEEREYNKIIYANVKEYLIDSVGQRMFDKLLHDYGNKCTDDISRVKLSRFKNKLKNKGITITFFENNGGKNVT